MAQHTEVIARAVIIHDGALLVCMAAAGYGYLPGGHVEFGEPAEAALKRELIEECGRPIRVGRLLVCHEFTFQAKKTHHELNLVFAAKLVRPKAAVQSLEPDISFAWLTRTQLAKTDLRPAEMKALLLSRWAAFTSGKSMPTVWIPQSSTVGARTGRTRV